MFVSYPSSQGWVVASSAMSHYIHQQLPRWHSETLSVVTLLEPLSHHFSQTALAVLLVTLDPVEDRRRQPQSFTYSLPLVCHVTQFNKNIETIVNIWKLISNVLYM